MKLRQSNLFIGAPLAQPVCANTTVRLKGKSIGANAAPICFPHRRTVGATLAHWRASGGESREAKPVGLVTAWRNLDRTERIARLRSLAVAARLLLGRQSDTLIALLRLAEGEDRGARAGRRGDRATADDR